MHQGPLEPYPILLVIIYMNYGSKEVKNAKPTTKSLLN